jgi:hypothetical protein
MDHLNGKYIVFIGLIVVLIGVIVYFFGHHLNWVGKPPGDIRVEKKNFLFYFPITTMVLISLILTLLIALFKKFL